MHKIKTQNGITLIVLIITIIVMLILVGLTVTVALNGGLFEIGGKAATDTKNAINEEQKIADEKIKVDGKLYNSVDDYINGNTSLPEGVIKINHSVDYHKDRALIHLTLEIGGGIQTFEEFKENILKNKTTEEIEALFAMGYPGSFDDLLIEENWTREGLKGNAEQNGISYEKMLIDNSSWIRIEYLFNMYGVKEVSEIEALEALFIETINYEGNFDDFLAEQSMTREQLEQLGNQQFGLTYEDTLKVLITQNGGGPQLTVGISNGETKKIPYINEDDMSPTDLKMSFAVQETGTYKITVTGRNGQKGETSIEINNIYEEKFSEIYAETKTYTDKNGETAVIPKGYAVGMSEGINAVNTGLVIRDANGNEFIWIPVTDELGEYYKYDNYSYEPKVLTDSWPHSTLSTKSKYDSQGTLDQIYGKDYYTYSEDFKYVEEYAEMVEKVNKNNGFYIGRYETTIDNEGNIGSEYNTKILRNSEVLFTKDSTNYPYRWYGLYYEQKNADVSGNGTDVQTAMIYGVLWDKTMDFIRQQKIAGNTNYNVDKCTAIWHNADNASNSAQANAGDVALNIWDLESNGQEWTQEAWSTYMRVGRGSYFNGINCEGASQRDSYWPDYYNGLSSSRLALYICN